MEIVLCNYGFLIGFVLFSFAPNLIERKLGMKFSVKIGCVICIVSLALRIIAFQFKIIQLFPIGQIVGGMGLPLISFLCCKISSEWFFQKNRRFVAQSYLFSWILGTFCGLFLPRYFTNNTYSSFYHQQFLLMMIIQGSVVAFVQIVLLVVFNPMTKREVQQKEQPVVLLNLNENNENENKFQYFKKILKNQFLWLNGAIYGSIFSVAVFSGITLCFSLFFTYDNKNQQIMTSIVILSSIVLLFILQSVVYKKTQKFNSQKVILYSTFLIVFLLLLSVVFTFVGVLLNIFTLSLISMISISILPFHSEYISEKLQKKQIEEQDSTGILQVNSYTSMLIAFIICECINQYNLNRTLILNVTCSIMAGVLVILSIVNFFVQKKVALEDQQKNTQIKKAKSLSQYLQEDEDEKNAGCSTANTTIALIM